MQQLGPELQPAAAVEPLQPAAVEPLQPAVAVLLPPEPEPAVHTNTVVEPLEPVEPVTPAEPLLEPAEPEQPVVELQSPAVLLVVELILVEPLAEGLHAPLAVLLEPVPTLLALAAGIHEAPHADPQKLGGIFMVGVN